MIPHLATFLQSHPGLSIDVVLDDRNVDLLLEGIDVALRMGDLVDSNLTARRVGQSRRMVVATPDYVARAGAPHSPGELAAHQAIVYDQGGGGGSWRFRKEREAMAVTLSGRLRVTAAEGVRAAVLAGLGLSVASEWMFAPELADGSVVQLLPEWTLPTIGLWAIFPSGRRASAKARAFVDFVQASLR